MAAATARSAIAAAATTAVRLQAQAAAITAARTRTLMSAAAQAQAAQARAAAIARSQHIISSGPNTHSHADTNTHSTHSTHSKPNTSTHSKYISPSERKEEPASVGPSYTKNNGVTAKYNKLGFHGMRGTNYKRYDYDYSKKTTTTIPNSSLRGHHAGYGHGHHGYGVHDGYDGAGPHGKPPKRKKLKATHQYQLRTAANEKWVDPTMTDWPENDFRIFCGDLGNEVSDAMLTSAFSKYPSFAKAKVVRDKRTGKSKGYGFVSFLEPHDFIRAFKEMNGKYVGNRPIKLRRSKWKERMKKVKNFKIRE